MVSDPARALDILCRPWAPPPPKEDSLTAAIPKKHPESKTKKRTGPNLSPSVSKKVKTVEKGVWKGNERISLRDPKARHRILREKRAQQSAQAFINGNRQRELDLQNRDSELYEDDLRETSDYRDKWISQTISPLVLKYFPRVNESDAQSDKPSDIELPSWVASIEGAPFGQFKYPGMNRERTGRKNADSLVGIPDLINRNYTAAQTQKAETKDFKLRFKKRPKMGHYSLFVKGFILDEIAERCSPAYGGQIPKVWTGMAGWDDWYNEDPPDDFLRTLVADRGKYNRNPPYYYAKACRESVIKGSGESGRVNVEGLINSEQNSIITEFCRRVQEVIWNRRLIRTRRGILGLAPEKAEVGDLVCIVYGCSVPLIMRQFSKADQSNQPDISSATTQTGQPPDTQQTSPLKEKLLQMVNRVASLNKNGVPDGYDAEDTAEKAKEDLIAAVNELLSNEKTVNQSSGHDNASHLESILEEERTEDRMEALKAWIRRCETKFVQRARYKELTVSGFSYNKVNYTGPEYKAYIEKATTIVNRHLRKMREIEVEKTRRAEEAKKELEQLALTLNRPAENKEDDAPVERINDLHYYYKLIGESYIHGMMDGEAIREKFRRKIPENDPFEIR